MEYHLVLDNTVLGDLKRDECHFKAAMNASAKIQYYVPVTQELEFFRNIDHIPEPVQDSIQEVAEALDPELLRLDSAPWGVAPFGAGPFGGSDSPHYGEILRANAS